MESKNQNKKLNFETSAGGHNFIRLEKVGQLNEEDTVLYITKEKDMNSMIDIRIHTN